MTLRTLLDYADVLGWLLTGQIGVWSIAYLLGENRRLREQVEELRYASEGGRND